VVNYLQDVFELIVQLWSICHPEGRKSENPAIIAFYEEFCYNMSRFKKCPFWTTIDEIIEILRNTNAEDFFDF